MLRGLTPVAALAVLLGLAFVLAFAAETGSQLLSAWGDLTASDAAGDIFDAGRITAHGWETFVQRALVASLYAGLIAMVHWGTGR